MALTDQEIERVYYHLGYPEVVIRNGQAPSIQLGVPRPVETSFLVGQAVSSLVDDSIPYTIDRIRRLLNILDNLENQIEAAACTLAAEKLGEMTLRGAEHGKTFPDLLEREYVRWAARLADVLGVPLYPYSRRFANAAAMGGGGVYSIPVHR